MNAKHLPVALLCVCFALTASLIASASVKAEESGPPSLSGSFDCPPGYIGIDGEFVQIFIGGGSGGTPTDNPYTYPTWENGNLLIHDCGAGSSSQGCVVVRIIEYQPTTTYCDYLADHGIDCHDGGDDDDDDDGGDCTSGSGGSEGNCDSGEEGGEGGTGGYSPNSDIDAPPTCRYVYVHEDGLVCYPSCAATTAEGGVACLDVRREPYPRGLVSVPNVFVVQGPFSKEGNTVSCPDPSVEFPLYTNRQLRVVWRMRQDIPPAWFFDERSWNLNRGVPNIAFGLRVEHTYETASYNTYDEDKPYNGPGLTGELLSAYQVRVDTWWTAYLVREWDEYGWDDEYEWQTNAQGEEEWVRTKHEYVSRGHQVVEERLDLRAYGWPTSDLFSRHAWDSRQESLPPYTCRIIPVPIIEAQSNLTRP